MIHKFRRSWGQNGQLVSLVHTFQCGGAKDARSADRHTTQLVAMEYTPSRTMAQLYMSVFAFSSLQTHHTLPAALHPARARWKCSKDPWTEQRGRRKDEKRVSTIIAHDNLPAHRRRLKSAERDLSYCLMPSGPFASGPAPSPVLRRSTARRSTSFCLRWG